MPVLHACQYHPLTIYANLLIKIRLELDPMRTTGKEPSVSFRSWTRRTTI